MAASPPEHSEESIVGRLRQARANIERGNRNAAQKLLWSIPYGSAPRTLLPEIGQAWWDLGFAAVAGRFWYFAEDKSATKTQACDEFERACGEDPQLLLELTLRLSEATDSEKARLAELRQKAVAARADVFGPTPKSGDFCDFAALWTCGLISFVLLFIFGAGITFIVSWFR